MTYLERGIRRFRAAAAACSHTDTCAADRQTDRRTRSRRLSARRCRDLTRQRRPRRCTLDTPPARPADRLPRLPRPSAGAPMRARQASVHPTRRPGKVSHYRIIVKSVSDCRSTRHSLLIITTTTTTTVVVVVVVVVVLLLISLLSTRKHCQHHYNYKK